MHEFVFLHWDIVKDQNSCRPVTSSVVPGCLGSFAEISKRNQKWISEHTRVLRKVLHSVNRNRNLATLFMVSCSTDCVWWPNTETYSPQLPARLRNYTHCSGIHIHIFLFNYWCTLWIHPFLSNMCMCFFFRILVQICKTQAFQKLNPAQVELHDEVNDAIQVSYHRWRLSEIITDSIFTISL